MTIRAIVFDIGGVLEITPSLGAPEQWEAKLGMAPGGLDEALREVWHAGGIGAISEDEVHRRIGDLLNLDDVQVTAFMDDMWTEYLGTLNVELADHLRGLRPRYKTGIISNSFVGAREREEERYRFSEMTDLIVYSHEVGVGKPDRRIFELACEGLEVSPREMVFLDDVQVIFEAARAIGIHAILFENNAQAIAEIEACLRASSATPAGSRD